MRQVFLYQDEDGAWIAEVPSLPGCHSAGDTREEAIENIKDAIQGWLEHAEEFGLEVPEDPGTASVESIEGQEGFDQAA